jgi:hypothetical protein
LKSPIASLLVALVASAPAFALELPDARVTPGAIGSSDPAIVCVRGYSRTVRPPYDYDWRRLRVSVFQAYGIPHEQRRGYTIEHLIPLELGGAPEDLRNVWPEPKTDAKRKDEVEDALLSRDVLSSHANAGIGASCDRAELDRDAGRPAGDSRASLRAEQRMTDLVAGECLKPDAVDYGHDERGFCAHLLWPLNSRHFWLSREPRAVAFLLRHRDALREAKLRLSAERFERSSYAALLDLIERKHLPTEWLARMVDSADSDDPRDSVLATIDR